MTQSSDSVSSQTPVFVAGEFTTNHTLCDLDLMAETAGWMAEPRDMIHIRSSDWYHKPIAEFVATATPQTSGRPRPNRRILSHTFVFWRMLDWACGMDPSVTAWLNQHTGHSITHAIRTRDIAGLDTVYLTHMRGPIARAIPVAAPAITHKLDYAERLFGFHPATDIVVLVPFLISKAVQDTDGIDDAVYFLARAVYFLMSAGEPGRTLLGPHIPGIRDLATQLEAPHTHPACAAPSAYTQITVLEEARHGVKCILKAWEQSEPGYACYLKILDLALLDDLYNQLYDVPLRELVARNYSDPAPTTPAVTG